MAISLNDFRELSNGEYNAGQIDFKTDRNGNVTGLKKVNNHVTFKSLNGVEIGHARSGGERGVHPGADGRRKTRTDRL